MSLFVGYCVGKAVEDVLMAACNQKSAWDSFTKPQRKSISQWKDSINVSSLQPLLGLQSCSLKPKTILCPYISEASSIDNNMTEDCKAN